VSFQCKKMSVRCSFLMYLWKLSPNQGSTSILLDEICHSTYQENWRYLSKKKKEWNLKEVKNERWMDQRTVRVSKQIENTK
jgi:hypothetical protein